MNVKIISQSTFYGLPCNNRARLSECDSPADKIACVYRAILLAVTEKN